MIKSSPSSLIPMTTVLNKIRKFKVKETVHGTAANLIGKTKKLPQTEHRESLNGGKRKEA